MNDFVVTITFFHTFYRYRQKSCAIAKMTARCALYMGALKIFGEFLTTTTATIPEIFYGLLFRSIL